MINWHWTEEEDQKLRQLFPVMPTENVAARLGRSLSAVRNRAWFEKVPVSDIASHIGRTERAVRKYGQQIGLKRRGLTISEKAEIIGPND